MSVHFESQIHATCDSCGEYEMSSVLTLAEMKKYLRGCGWRIGVLTLCPQCAKAAKRESHK